MDLFKERFDEPINDRMQQTTVEILNREHNAIQDLVNQPRIRTDLQLSAVAQVLAHMATILYAGNMQVAVNTYRLGQAMQRIEDALAVGTRNPANVGEAITECHRNLERLSSKLVGDEHTAAKLDELTHIKYTLERIYSELGTLR